jgi:hypothetical protein
MEGQPNSGKDILSHCDRRNNGEFNPRELNQARLGYIENAFC